jgi:hypothetical protein
MNDRDRVRLQHMLEAVVEAAAFIKDRRHPGTDPVRATICSAIRRPFLAIVTARKRPVF